MLQVLELFHDLERDLQVVALDVVYKARQFLQFLVGQAYFEGTQAEGEEVLLLGEAGVGVFRLDLGLDVHALHD